MKKSDLKLMNEGIVSLLLKYSKIESNIRDNWSILGNEEKMRKELAAIGAIINNEFIPWHNGFLMLFSRYENKYATEIQNPKLTKIREPARNIMDIMIHCRKSLRNIKSLWMEALKATSIRKANYFAHSRMKRAMYEIENIIDETGNQFGELEAYIEEISAKQKALKTYYIKFYKEEYGKAISEGWRDDDDYDFMTPGLTDFYGGIY